MTDKAKQDEAKKSMNEVIAGLDAKCKADKKKISRELRSSNLIFNLFKKLAYKVDLKHLNKIKRLAF